MSKLSGRSGPPPQNARPPRVGAGPRMELRTTWGRIPKPSLGVGPTPGPRLDAGRPTPSRPGAATPARGRLGDSTLDAPRPLAVPTPKPPLPRVPQNRAVGLDAQQGLRAILQTKGLSIRGSERTVQAGPGGSRLDTQIPTRSLESKHIDLTKPTYRTGGGLNLSRIMSRIRGDARQVAKHARAIAKGQLVNERTGAPLKESLVYSVKADTPQEAARFRAIARQTVKTVDPKVKVGVVPADPRFGARPVELDPRPTGGGVLFGILAPKAWELFEAGMGWDLEARERLGVFRMSPAQQRKLEQLRADQRYKDFFGRVAQRYSDMGVPMTAKEVEQNARRAAQGRPDQAPSWKPATPDPRNWTIR